MVTTTPGLSHSDIGLSAGTYYAYRVATVGNAGTGAYSEEVHERTTGTAMGGDAPALSADTTYPGTVELTWNEPARGPFNCPVNRYELEWSPDNTEGSWQYLEERGADRQRVHTDYAEGGTTRYYRIRAIDTCGIHSEWSAALSATTTYHPPQGTYMDAIATGTSQVMVSWQEPFDGGIGIDRQELQASTDGGTTHFSLANNLPGETLSYLHRGLAQNATLEYRLRACNQGGCSEWSVSQPVTVGLNAVPTAPVLSAEVISASTVSLSWTQADGGSEGISRYRMEYAGDDGLWTWFSDFWPDSNRRFLDEYLSHGETRHYRIRASNSNGDGPWSEVVTRTTIADAPTAPRELVATRVSDHQIDLRWEAPEERADNGVTYRIERIDEYRTGDDDWEDWSELWETAGSATGLFFSDTSLYPGTTYYYRVVAINAAGQGPYSEQRQGTTTGDIPWKPAPPTVMRFINIGKGQATIAWEEPHTDNGRPVLYYQYQVKGHGQDCAGWESEILRTQKKQASINNLPTCNGKYGFQVRAVNRIGASDWAYPDLIGRLPGAANVRLIAQPDRLTVGEGATKQFKVKLGKSPAKPLELGVFMEGDPDITNWDTVQVGGYEYQSSRLTADNWNEGVTVTVDMPYDDDAIDGTAWLHFYVYTADLPSASVQRTMTTEEWIALFEPEFHGLVSAGVLITEDDPD